MMVSSSTCERLFYAVNFKKCSGQMQTKFRFITLYNVLSRPVHSDLIRRSNVFAVPGPCLLGIMNRYACAAQEISVEIEHGKVSK